MAKADIVALLALGAALFIAIGDVITGLDGTSLDSATTLTYVLDRHYPGDVINVTWIDRSGQQRTGKAALVPGP